MPSPSVELLFGACANQLLGLIGGFLLCLHCCIFLQAGQDSGVVIRAGSRTTGHEDGVVLAVLVRLAADGVELQLALRLMGDSGQVGTLGCAALPALLAIDRGCDFSVVHANMAALIIKGSLILLVLFHLLGNAPRMKTRHETRIILYQTVWYFVAFAHR